MSKADSTYSKQLKERLKETINNLSKTLSCGDLNSLKHSAKTFTDFGPEAEQFMLQSHLPDSVLDRFLRELIRYGFPFKTVREAASRKLFLLLAIQNNWFKGLGDILENTNFYKSGFHSGKLELYTMDNTYKPINRDDLSPNDKIYLEKILKYDNIHKYRLISITITKEFSMVCAFEKRKKVYRILNSVYEKQQEKEEVLSDFPIISIPLKKTAPRPFPFDIPSILNSPPPSYLK